MRSRPTSRLWLTILGAFAAGVAGCNGSGVLHVMPYVRSDLPEHEPLIQNTPIQEAYYWQEEDGQLNIALRSTQKSLLGEVFSAEYAMSIVLEDLPAGSERLYNVTIREIQSALRAGGDRRRSRSMLGVVVIEAPEHGVLKGRFHALMHEQRFTALTGWTPPSVFQGARMVVAGEFNAVHDPERGREILAVTEDDNFVRPVPREQRPRAEWLDTRPAPKGDEKESDGGNDSSDR